MSVFSLVARFWLTAERSFQVPRSLSRSSADERETDDSRINNASVMLNAITRPVMGFLLAALHAFVGQRVHNGGYRIARRMSGHGPSRTETQSARSASRRAQFQLWIFSYTKWGGCSKKCLSTLLIRLAANFLLPTEVPRRSMRCSASID